jgi:hypothetical protein
MSTIVKYIYIAVIKLIKITNEIILISIQPAIHVTTDMYPTCVNLKLRAFPVYCSVKTQINPGYRQLPAVSLH